jgi:hypothetical protein
MPTITFRGRYVVDGGGLWRVVFTCDDNRTIGKCKIRLVDGNFFASSLGSYIGMYRLDSLDGQLRNPYACSNYGGLLLSPFDPNQVWMRDVLQNDKSFEFEADLRTSTLSLTLTPATLEPNTPVSFTTINFDSGFLVFDVEPIN